MRNGWNEIKLNVVHQWVSLRGDPGAPILLFLHSGPGGAEFGPRRHYLGGLEKTWQVVDLGPARRRALLPRRRDRGHPVPSS